MRLTQAQRSVIERMAAGAIFFHSRAARAYKLRDQVAGGFDNTTVVSKYLVDKLKASKVIERNGMNWDGTVFRLTDLGRSLAQQKTPPPPN